MNSNNGGNANPQRRNGGGFTPGRLLPATEPSHPRNYVVPMNDTLRSGFEGSVPQGPISNIDLIDTMLNL